MLNVSSTRFATSTATISLFLIVAGCNTQSDAPEAAIEFDSLVTAEWLAEHLDDPDLVVLDCSVIVEPTGDGGFRTVNGRGNYEAGHIPTAGFADLKGALSDAGSTLDYAVPDPEVFAAAMAELGVGDDTRVVLYDANMSVWAARVWWMLRWIGFDNAALLDGGQDAWTSAGFELSTDPANEPVRSLSVNLRPELIVDKEEVLAAIDDDSVDLQDALPEAQYRGDMVMYARPGHIPTASNVSVMSLRAENGQFRSTDELNAIFDSDRSRRTITYCGGGIAASGNAFIMTRLGFDDVAVYTASLQEWASDPELPMVTADDVAE
jgi:thiosulfate/3-mercaptopyruvate sulfurtransferase